MHRRPSLAEHLPCMRRVTAKPPNMLIGGQRDPRAPRATGSAPLAGRSGRSVRPAAPAHQRADRDDARDRVGDAHQRRVQRRRHVPDHHVADEAGQHEHREVAEERRRRERADQPGTAHARRRTPPRGLRPTSGRFRRRHAPCPLLRRAAAAGFAAAGGAAGFGRRRPGDLAVALITVRPRIASSSKFTSPIVPSLVLQSSSVSRSRLSRTASTTGARAGWRGRCSR